jgi:hypothetical protein
MTEAAKDLEEFKGWRPGLVAALWSLDIEIKSFDYATATVGVARRGIEIEVAMPAWMPDDLMANHVGKLLSAAEAKQGMKAPQPSPPSRLRTVGGAYSGLPLSKCGVLELAERMRAVLHLVGISEAPPGSVLDLDGVAQRRWLDAAAILLEPDRASRPSDSRRR